MRFLSLGVSLLGLACSSPATPDLGLPDAGRPPDAGIADAGAPPADRGLPDVGMPDLGVLRAPSFVDVAEVAGIAERHADPELDRCTLNWPEVETECWFLRQMGGVAVGDVDADGWEDLYFSHPDRPGTLFRNLGDGTFEDITADAGLDVIDAATNGAAFVDVDRDGDLDLYLTVVGPPEVRDQHYLMIQGDDGVFTDETTARGAGVPSDRFRGGFSVSVGDYDRDGWPDLHVNEWIDDSHPDPFTVVGNTRLLRNRGAACPGCFEDVTLDAGVDVLPPCPDVGEECKITGFSSAFVDFDGDRWPDLLAVRDFGVSRLFWNRADGTFGEATRSSGVGTDIFGMGSTVGDIDGDGDLDWFISEIGDNPDELCGVDEEGNPQICQSGSKGNSLFRNDGDRRFVDVAASAGVQLGGWGWGAAFWDHDNDGDLDLLQANGMDYEAANSQHELHVSDRIFLWDNDGTGAFTDVGEGRGIDDRGVTVAVALFDYDRDGDQDAVVVRNYGVPALYRNDGADEQAWLRVRLSATVSASEGVGAWVHVRVREGEPERLRVVDSVSHFLGQSERVAHFGLGLGVSRVDQVRVEWPSGRRTVLRDVEVRRELLLDESDAVAP